MPSTQSEVKENCMKRKKPYRHHYQSRQPCLVNEQRRRIRFNLQILQQHPDACASKFCAWHLALTQLIVTVVPSVRQPRHASLNILFVGLPPLLSLRYPYYSVYISRPSPHIATRRPIRSLISILSLSHHHRHHQPLAIMGITHDVLTVTRSITPIASVRRQITAAY